MEPIQQYGTQPTMQGGGKPWWTWVVVVLVVIIFVTLAAWYLGYLPLAQFLSTEGELPAPLTGGDTTMDIAKDLDAVDLGNVGGELDQLDAEINQL